MSRRFGRNQKRRLVGLLEAAQGEIQLKAAAIRQNLKDIKELQLLGQKNREAVERTREILGRHFVGLEPAVQSVDHDFDRFRIPKMPRLPAFLGDLCPADSVTYMIEELEVARPQADIDRLSGHMHLMLKLPTGALRYAFTLQAIREMSEDDLLHQVAKLFAPALAKHCRGERRPS